jgi:glucose-6-phosphate 1-dehydrogenase
MSQSHPPTQISPAAMGMSKGKPPEPCLMVLCGASGDLAGRELLPALYELATRELLPEPFALVGFAVDDWDDDEYRRRMRKKVEEQGAVDPAAWERFARHLHYVPGDFTAPADGDYAKLAARVGEVRDDLGIPDHVFFHFAVPPALFAVLARRLGECGLARSEGGWRRLVVEKPFGEDRASALALDRDLRGIFAEEQIYRIDHFLGKETVQNMLVFRFANPSFEPIWNRNYIDHVQITVAEELGIGTRAGFYEHTGVVRDMVQNHLLQLLCMVAVEPPLAFDATALRNETLKVLQAIRPPAPGDCVRGQYAAGRIGDEAVPGYRQEPGVADGSDTATFAALRLTLDNWRWEGVPFYLRTGKRMARKLTEVAVEFKPTPHLMFPREAGRPLHRHQLAFRLQPEEGVLQTYIGKRPGPDLRLVPVTSHFLYADTFGIERLPRAYSWLLLDVMQGDSTLFARSDWIDAAWSIVDPLVERWQAPPAGGFPNYDAGTWGPPAADRLLRADGRAWRTL